MIALLYIVVPAIAGLLGAAVSHAAVLAVCRISAHRRRPSPTHAKDAASSVFFLVALVFVGTRGSNSIRSLLWFEGSPLLGAVIFWAWVAWVRRVHRHAVTRFGPRRDDEQTPPAGRSVAVPTSLAAAVRDKSHAYPCVRPFQRDIFTNPNTLRRIRVQTIGMTTRFGIKSQRDQLLSVGRRRRIHTRARTTIMSNTTKIISRHVNRT